MLCCRSPAAAGGESGRSHSLAGAGPHLWAALPSKHVSEGWIQMQDGESGMGNLQVPSESVTGAFPKQVSHRHRDQCLRFFYSTPRSYREVKSIKCSSSPEQCQQGQSSPFGAQRRAGPG